MPMTRRASARGDTQPRQGPLRIRGRHEQNEALITAGLEDDEQVVTLGVQKLEAGLKVRAVEAR